MKYNNQIDITYDPNICPYYESDTKLNNKSIVVYNMDEHQNKIQLSKISHIVEFYTAKQECIIAPKLVIDNLFLTDSDAISDYFQIQVKLRKGVVRSKQFTYILGIILLTYLVGLTIQYFNFNTLTNSLIIGGLLALILLGLFFSQAILLKSYYTSFVQNLVNKYGRDTVLHNFQTIIDNIEKSEYFEEYQVVNTKNHYSSLIELIRKKGL